MEYYYKCNCGSETFIKVYNVQNEKIKVKSPQKMVRNILMLNGLGKKKIIYMDIYVQSAEKMMVS